MQGTRKEWVDMMLRVAAPVLEHLANDTLKQHMPVETREGMQKEREPFAHLEAFGRTICGMAPWLETPCKDVEEETLRQKYAALARQGIHHATCPSSRDKMNFSAVYGPQPLVDGAFLAQGILRAPVELYKKLDKTTQKNLKDCLKELRRCTAHFNNWLLFAAMVETALHMMGEECDFMRIDYALRQHEQWYQGDGIYGDGPKFHFDYYNSFVIQPMLVDVITRMNAADEFHRWDAMVAPVMNRAARYAQILERMILPDGSFPAIGRSLAYRTGCFGHLSAMSLMENLPEGLNPAQVRCALTAVIRKTLLAPGTFDADGWLQIGLCGHQPSIAEPYICTGSLYLCSTVFLALGLHEDHVFWCGSDVPWTQQNVWSGKDIVADHAIED